MRSVSQVATNLDQSIARMRSLEDSIEGTRELIDGISSNVHKLKEDGGARADAFDRMETSLMVRDLVVYIAAFPKPYCPIKRIEYAWNTLNTLAEIVGARHRSSCRHNRTNAWHCPPSHGSRVWWGWAPVV